MAEFLTTYAVSAQIEKIISGARSELYLVTPFLKLSEILFHRLQDADRKRVRTSLVYGKEELHYEQEQNLKALQNLQLFFMESLHAKCYCNENEMIITSMNMYEFSERNNREMGVLISRSKDRELYEDAFEEIRSIIAHAEEQSNGYSYTRGHSGFCIRCGEEIPHNPDRPYCNHCYRVWAGFNNPDYTERHCHSCNKPFESSMNRPECDKCYRKSARR